jgi:hypothetical protein
MKKISKILLLIAYLSGACAQVPEHAFVPTDLPTPSATNTNIPPANLNKPANSTLPINAAWQIQYADETDLTLDVDVYNLDLFDTDSAAIAQLHERGIFVMCYFSAGSFEDWRPDINDFPNEILGKDYEGWAGEKWLDIRKTDLLAPIMLARLDLASQKGCDGVDPDNVHGFINDTGFPLTYEDQLHYNIWLAEAAHTRGLLIGLKNDIEQIPDLLPYFDWQLNEECFQYDECELLLPFIKAGKPVFNVEYTLAPEDFCPQANEMGFNSIRKNLILDAFIKACH